MEVGHWESFPLVDQSTSVRHCLVCLFKVEYPGLAYRGHMGHVPQGLNHLRLSTVHLAQTGSSPPVAKLTISYNPVGTRKPLASCPTIHLVNHKLIFEVGWWDSMLSWCSYAWSRRRAGPCTGRGSDRHRLIPVWDQGQVINGFFFRGTG